MRAFIAIELSDGAKQYLAKLQTQLKKSGADIKWVNPSNIHLTLKFLGEINEEQLAEISGIMQKIASSQKEFVLGLGNIGAFPDISSAKVIWAGVNEGEEETKFIAKNLEEAISEIGIPKEGRPFSSHITIGRPRSGLNRTKLMQLLKELTEKPAEEKPQFKVARIALYKSTLTSEGPIYEALREVNLKTN